MMTRITCTHKANDRWYLGMGKEELMALERNLSLLEAIYPDPVAPSDPHPNGPAEDDLRCLQKLLLTIQKKIGSPIHKSKPRLIFQTHDHTS